MKIDVTVVLKGIDKEDLYKYELQGQEVVKTDKKLTLRSVCTDALLGSYRDDNVSGEEKFKRWKLSLRVNAEDQPDLTPEELTLVRSLIGKGQTTLVIGRAYELLG